MHWLRKYWQAVLSTTAPKPVEKIANLRVDVAGCRVIAPPVRRWQRAYYISRADAAVLPSVGVGGKSSYETNGKHGARTSQERVAQNQNATFDEWFTATVALADDVLFVPVSPATATTGVAVAFDLEHRPMARVA